MNRYRRLATSSPIRRGFTRVELLAVLVVALLVFRVLAPGILYQRRKARMAECLHSIRNVALATLNFASSNDGEFPPLISTQRVTNAKGEQGNMRVAWPILLLPALDNTALLKSIRNNAVVKSGQALIGPGERIKVEVLTCWDDPVSADNPGGLTYVMNTGFIAEQLYHGDPDGKHIPGSLAWWSTPGDASAVAVQNATGAVWSSPSAPAGSLQYVADGDGTSSTLLISENLQAGDWYDTDTARIGFGFPVPNNDGKVAFGKGRIFESESVGKSLNTQFEGASFETLKVKDWRINSDLKAKVGTLPRPSSNHQGGVNVMMCDGSGKFLNQNIDPHVYLKLLTSNGATYGEGELNPSEIQPW